jgi:hypothetical protein
MHARRSHRRRLRAPSDTRVGFIFSICPSPLRTKLVALSPTSLGIFRLTDPPGLQLIMSCNQTATFHPHPEPKGGIYTGSFGDRDRGFGHVRSACWAVPLTSECLADECFRCLFSVREGQGIEVVDLREESRGVLSWGRDK